MALRIECPHVKRGYHLVRLFKTEEEIFAAEELTYTEKEIIRQSESNSLADSLICAGLIKYFETLDEGYTTLVMFLPEGSLNED